MGRMRAGRHELRHITSSLLMSHMGGGYPPGALILRAFFRCIPPPRGIELGDVYLIKMLAFSVGVACGAKKCLYVMPTMTFSQYFCFWDARRGKAFEHFGQKTMRILKIGAGLQLCNRNCPIGGGLPHGTINCKRFASPADPPRKCWIFGSRI